MLDRTQVQTMQELNKNQESKRTLLTWLAFIFGPLLAGLSALVALAGIAFPDCLRYAIFIISGPSTVYYVISRWLLCFKQRQDVSEGKDI